MGRRVGENSGNGEEGGRGEGGAQGGDGEGKGGGEGEEEWKFRSFNPQPSDAQCGFHQADY